MDEENYIDIDDTQLDREVLVQPKRMRRWGKKLAKARLRQNEAKAKLDLVEADLMLKISTSPEEYELEKSTEMVVKAAVKVQPEYKAALKELNRAKFEVDNYDAMVTALHQRKSALEMRIQLMGMEYYPEVRQDAKARKGLEEQMTRNAFKPLKKKKRKPE